MAQLKPALMLQAFASGDNLVVPTGLGVALPRTCLRAGTPQLAEGPIGGPDEPAQPAVYCREYTETKLPEFSVNVLPLTVPV